MTKGRRFPDEEVGVVTSRGRTESSISLPRSLRTVMYCIKQRAREECQQRITTNRLPKFFGAQNIEQILREAPEGVMRIRRPRMALPCSQPRGPEVDRAHVSLSAQRWYACGEHLPGADPQKKRPCEDHSLAVGAHR